MKYLGITGLTYLCNKISTAISGCVKKTSVANNLTTTAAGSVLDARQGKILNEAINNKKSDFDNPVDYETSGSAPYDLNNFTEPGIYNLFGWEPKTELLNYPVFSGDTSTIQAGTLYVMHDSSYYDGSYVQTVLTESGMAIRYGTVSPVSGVLDWFQWKTPYETRISSLEDYQFLGWRDTYGPDIKTIPSDIINLSRVNTCYTDGRAGLYFIECSMEVIDTPFTGTLVMQINDGSNDLIYDVRYIPEGVEAPSMRIYTLTNISANAEVSIYAGQLNSSGNARKISSNFIISKFIHN